MATVIQISLISKPGCHLCDEARRVLETVIAQFRSTHSGVAANVQVQLEEVSILEDQELFSKYSEEIPVVKINGEVHGYWRIDPIRLLAALESKL